MKRARQKQAGCVFRKGMFWYVRYREPVVLADGTVRQVHRSRKLTEAIGPYQTKRAAEGLAEKTLRPLNDGVLVAESTMTLNRFMETVYLPYAERQKRRSTFVGYRNLWKRYIKPDGDRALREFRTFECEQMLTSIARTQDLCRSTLGHIKHFLGGAFRYARRQGVLDSPNPMRDVEIPKARPAGETHAYSLEEEVRMLAILPEPAATIVAVAAFTGARKGEIRGFLWESYDGFAIEVKQSVWRNQVGEPKREKSKGTIPVIAQLKLFLDQHRTRSGNPVKGFIFRNPLGNSLNLDALVSEVIRPAIEAEKIPWYGWHAFRRGLATNLHRLGVSDKVIQQILRHANVTTTINIYVKMVTRDAEEAMKKLESNCSLVVPQTVPQLTFESGKVGAKTGEESARKTLPLEAVRGNLAERGGFEPPVGVLAPTTV
jgi:integrase